MELDVGRVIDEGNWTARGKLLVAGTAVAIILDGVDNQLLGIALPSLMKDWSLPRSAFSTALAMSPLGMMAGGALGGVLGDRIGRRNALLGSVICFAVLTAAVATVNSLAMLAALRFLAGLGLGGAMPNAAALAAEYVPRRQRAFAVTLTIVCIPLGAMLAAFVSARVIPAYGWQAMFLLGGVVPVLIALVLFGIMPESPRFLAARRERWPELIALLQRLGHPIASDATFVNADRKHLEKPHGSVRDMFAPGLGRDTIGLFGSFFFCLMVNYVAFQLLVSGLTGAGFTETAARDVLGWWSIGGVGGALAGAWFIHRFGSRITMLSLSAVAVVSALGLAAMPLDPRNDLRLILMCIVLGGAINAVQTTMYALAAHVYPTRIRGTGIGTAVAVGRVGNVLASYTGNFALQHGGMPAFFSTFAIGMFAVLISLAVVRNHIQRNATEPGR